MTYKVKVIWYDDIENISHNAGIFLVANNYRDAMDKLICLYGDRQMEKCEIEPFSPDYGVEFDLDDERHKLIFDMVVDIIGKDVMW